MVFCKATFNIILIYISRWYKSSEYRSKITAFFPLFASLLRLPQENHISLNRPVNSQHSTERMNTRLLIDEGQPSHHRLAMADEAC